MRFLKRTCLPATNVSVILTSLLFIHFPLDVVSSRLTVDNGYIVRILNAELLGAW